MGHPVFGGFFFLWELCLVWGYRMCILPSFSACLISVVISSVVPPRQTQREARLLFLLLSSSNETCRFEVPLKLLLTFRIRRLYSKVGHPAYMQCFVHLDFTLSIIVVYWKPLLSLFEAGSLYWIALWVMVLLEVFALTWALCVWFRGSRMCSTSLLQTQTAAFM